MFPSNNVRNHSHLATFGISTSYGAGSASITATPNPSSVTLASGATGTVDIDVTITAGSDPGSSKELIVKVNSEGQACSTRTVPIYVTLGDCAVSFTSVEPGCPGSTADLSFLVTNDGECDQSFDWRVIHESGDAVVQNLPISGTTSQLNSSTGFEIVTTSLTLGGTIGQSEVVRILLEGAENQIICTNVTTVSITCPIITFVSKDPSTIPADSDWPEMRKRSVKCILLLWPSICEDGGGGARWRSGRSIGGRCCLNASEAG